jgi:hypothetical protein
MNANEEDLKCRIYKFESLKVFCQLQRNGSAMLTTLVHWHSALSEDSAIPKP